MTAPNTGSGTLTLTLAANAVDQGLAETQASIEYARFSASWSNVPTSEVDNTFSAQLNVSHPVTGLTGSDLLLRRVSGNDSNPNFTNLTDSEVTVTPIAGTDNYTVEFDLEGIFDGVYYIRLRPRMVTFDGNNYPSGSVNSSNFSIVTEVPTATITFDRTSLRVGETAEATVVWSEAVTGFAISDLSVNVGSLSNFSGSGTTYTVDVTAPATGSGTITLTIRASAVTDGNAETSGNIAYATLPTATVTFDPASVRGGRTTEARIVWSESVTGFVIGDLSVDVGSLANFAGSGDTYTVDVTAPVTGSGNITLTIAEDAVDAGNAETDASVAYSPLPTATVTFDPTELRVGGTAEARIVWSETVTGFDSADLSVDVGTLANFSGTGDTYAVEVTAPATGSGNIAF